LTFLLSKGIGFYQNYGFHPPPSSRPKWCGLTAGFNTLKVSDYANPSCTQFFPNLELPEGCDGSQTLRDCFKKFGTITDDDCNRRKKFFDTFFPQKEFQSNSDCLPMVFLSSFNSLTVSGEFIRYSDKASLTGRDICCNRLYIDQIQPMCKLYPLSVHCSQSTNPGEKCANGVDYWSKVRNLLKSKKKFIGKNN